MKTSFNSESSFHKIKEIRQQELLQCSFWPGQKFVPKPFRTKNVLNPDFAFSLSVLVSSGTCKTPSDHGPSSNSKHLGKNDPNTPKVFFLALFYQACFVLGVALSEPGLDKYPSMHFIWIRNYAAGQQHNYHYMPSPSFDLPLPLNPCLIQNLFWSTCNLLLFVLVLFSYVLNLLEFILNLYFYYLVIWQVKKMSFLFLQCLND